MCKIHMSVFEIIPMKYVIKTSKSGVTGTLLVGRAKNADLEASNTVKFLFY